MVFNPYGQLPASAGAVTVAELAPTYVGYLFEFEWEALVSSCCNGSLFSEQTCNRALMAAAWLLAALLVAHLAAAARAAACWTAISRDDFPNCAELGANGSYALHWKVSGPHRSGLVQLSHTQGRMHTQG